MDAKQRAVELDSEGKCIVCGLEEKDRKRGLCVTDYSRFRNALMRVSPDRRSAFEARLIAAGRLLPSRQGQRGAIDDVFAQELEDFLGSADSEPSPAAQKALDEARRANAELERKIAPPKEGQKKRTRPRAEK